MISVGCHLKPDSSGSPWNDMFNMNYFLSSSNFLTALLHRSARYRKWPIAPFTQPTRKLNNLLPQGTHFPLSRNPGSRTGRLLHRFWLQGHSPGQSTLGTHAACVLCSRYHPLPFSAAGPHLSFPEIKGSLECSSPVSTV